MAIDKKKLLIPRTGHEGPEEVWTYSSILPLTSALNGVGCQRHVPAASPPVMRSGTHCIGDWVRPRAHPAYHHTISLPKQLVVMTAKFGCPRTVSGMTTTGPRSTCQPKKHRQPQQIKCVQYLIGHKIASGKPERLPETNGHKSSIETIISVTSVQTARYRTNWTKGKPTFYVIHTAPLLSFHILNQHNALIKIQ
jgi:hypothetical protein